MERVTSTSFSVSINGSLHGYFKGKHGLRQGDLMSPYHFTLVIEVLTFMLHRRAHDSDCFTYHRYCSKLNIVNLCFADDLFQFANGDVASTRVIMDTLEEFKNALGLTPSLPKSIAYFYNVLNYVKLDILNVLLFEEGKFPCQGEMRKGKAKVAWEAVCLPKKEGGLGIYHLEAFNKALITSHIWSLLNNKESLWVKWIHTYKLIERSFWDIPLRGKMSWGWRKILQVRQIVHPFIGYRLGDSSTTSTWFNSWCSLGPLAELISNRDIYGAGFWQATKVNEVIDSGLWRWNFDNLEVDFSIATAWSCIRPRATKVDWYYVVWFSHQIPRYAIHLWLCPLCETQPDSHDHLFFKCVFSLHVWEHLKRFTGLTNIPSDLNSIVDFLILLAKIKSTRSVISKLIFAAASYFIWQEQNNRLFKKTKRSQDQVIKVIKSTVLLKLLSCKFKKTKNVQMLFHLWKLPNLLIGSSH
ncbi:putative RNA-directed DNA polymerase, eukaryota, reverse transcriptase zinc-binding domain protein [Tanacetum coccineum]